MLRLCADLGTPTMQKMSYESYAVAFYGIAWTPRTTKCRDIFMEIDEQTPQNDSPRVAAAAKILREHSLFCGKYGNHCREESMHPYIFIPASHVLTSSSEIIPIVLQTSEWHHRLEAAAVSLKLPKELKSSIGWHVAAGYW